MNVTIISFHSGRNPFGWGLHRMQRVLTYLGIPEPILPVFS
jgi:hypothetical protein